MKNLMRSALLAITLVCPMAWAETALPVDLQIPNLGVVKTEIRTYVSSGRYAAEMESVAHQAKAYLQANKSRFQGKKPAMILDIDETSLSNFSYIDKADFGYQPELWDGWIASAQAPALPATLELYHYARANGVAVFFVSARDKAQRELTERNLRKAGYQDFEELVLRDGGPSSAAYKAAARRAITEKGYFIVVNVGDQQSDLDGGYADATFKLPNPMYYVP